MARQVLERLVEAGLVTARGVKKGRSFILSPKVYRRLGQPAGYVRQAGFDAIQQEQMVIQFVKSHGRIRRKDVCELCHINEDQATYLLRKLAQQGKLRLKGKGRGAHYQKL